MSLVLIGAGGTGSWLARKLNMLIREYDRHILIVDKDKLEEKNLDRQLFDESYIGMDKAQALADLCGCDYEAEFYHSGLDLNIVSEDILFCCADNHSCRREVLQTCDEKDCRAVVCGNEKIDYEAYWYESSWKDTPNDPRVFYPLILTDHENDPLGPPGCTGQAQEENPQLILANDGAAHAALLLYYFHVHLRPTLDMNDKQYWPVLHRGNPYRMNTIRWGDRL